MWNTWPCRNCGSSLLRPHQDGRHTSWNSPLAIKACQHGALRGQHLKTAANLVGAVLLLGRRGIGLVCAAWLAIWRRLRCGALASERTLIVLGQAGLNFVNDTHVAEKLHAATVGHMRRAVSVVIDGRRSDIRQPRVS